MKIINNEVRLIISLGLGLVVGVFALIWYVGDFQSRLIRQMALTNSQTYANTLSEFRTLYTSEVVDRIRTHPDITVSHDYLNTQYAIPLPATLSMKLGEQIGKQLSGAESFLYSPYPFPWRAQRGGLNNPFRVRAWDFLSRHPTQSYYEFEKINGREVIRFAQADLMREGCIDCHNSHPQSPKKGWKVGDLRGVLEVIQPLDVINQEAHYSLDRLYLLVATVAIMALLSFWFFIKQQRESREMLQRQLEQRTEQVKLSEAKLAATEKMAALGLVSVGIAHEVNQPLATMKLTLELLMNSLSKSGVDVSDKINRVLRQVERINRIITQLNISSAHPHFSQELPSPLDINQTIAQVLEWLNEDLQSAEVEVIVELASGLPHILMDRLELERVLTNLITNGIHAMEECKGPRVLTLLSYYDNDNVFISVDDTGKGIAEKDRLKIFDPFYTTKDVGKGMGMGLSLVQGIVNKNAGNIQLVNTEIGACFLLSFRLKI